MPEYRPEPTELWQTLRRNAPLVRRIALAIGGLMVGYAIGRAMGRGDMVTGAMAIGAAVIGFFGPRWPRKTEPND